MYIEVYGDILFLILWVPELISLWLITRWYHVTVRKWRMLWVSVLAAGASVAAAIGLRSAWTAVQWSVDLGIHLVIFRILSGTDTGKLFRLKSRRGMPQCLKAWCLQKILFVGMGGLFRLGWDQPRTLGWLLVGFGMAGLMSRVLIHWLQQKKEVEQHLYSVVIRWNDRTVRCMALLDTGNQLRYGAEPVVLLSPEKAAELGAGEMIRGIMTEKTLHDYRMIPYSSVGCPTGVLHGFVCDRMVIHGLQREVCPLERVVIAVADRELSGKREYEMLLHPALLDRGAGDRKGVGFERRGNYDAADFSTDPVSDTGDTKFQGVVSETDSGHSLYRRSGDPAGAAVFGDGGGTDRGSGAGG